MIKRQEIKAQLLYLMFVLALILMVAPWGYAENLRENFIVAIDIGHTRNCGGALSAHGIDEYYYNQKVAFLLLSELLNAGFRKSFIINEDGGDISLIDRTIKAKERRADLLISIHHDSVQPCYLSKWKYQGESLYYCDLFKGFCILVSAANSNARSNLLLALQLGTELLNRGFSPTLHHSYPVKGENRKLIDKERGVYEYNQLAILKNATMPAVILECGVIKNRNEEKSINSAYRNKIVDAIVAATRRYHDSLCPAAVLRNEKVVK